MPDLPDGRISVRPAELRHSPIDHPTDFNAWFIHSQYLIVSNYQFDTLMTVLLGLYSRQQETF